MSTGEHPDHQGYREHREYRIEDLAHLSGATVRTIRAYQDRGLLPRPERRGRSNVYGDTHLAGLRQIAGLLERGYTLASVKELLEAWDTGKGLGGVLGLVTEVGGPWTDEEAGRISRSELGERFGGKPGAAAAGEAPEKAIDEAVELGVLERVPGRDDEFLVPSPQELAVAAELHAAGVPLPAISGHLRELRGQVEHIAERFLEFTAEHVFAHFPGHHPPTDADAADAATLVRRLRPLAQRTVDAELARAMRLFATRRLQQRLGAADPPVAGPEPVTVTLPGETVRAVRALVGPARAAAFITAAAEREVRARTLDALAADGARSTDGGQIP
ncbi:MerR family transcriptional regulator [Streptomyces sp. Wb2n-11]|uniref:MerR family transcriptional regulator n=1 Tax=Streptomyces sp. Wb2n-11 TaxID=1030533 RepID=UPI000A550519|nr:MerR family transcriptional regulator [Streptomyces sp. Wb2n-11]